MGASIRRCCARRQPQCKHKVDCMMIGMRQCGKSTILSKLRLLPVDGLRFTEVDAGVQSLRCPQDSARKAVIYVVDSTDDHALETVHDHLMWALHRDELKGAALLVFANKQDHPSALPVAILNQKLKLHSIRDRPWFTQRCSALTGQGIHAGLHWLQEIMIKSAPQTSLTSDANVADELVNEHRISIRGLGASVPVVRSTCLKGSPSEHSDSEESVADTASTADTEGLDADCLSGRACERVDSRAHGLTEVARPLV